jgi:hypothetical protein
MVRRHSRREECRRNVAYVARNVWPTGRKLAGRTRSRWLSDCSVLTARPASGLRLQLKANSESPDWAQAAQEARNVRHKAAINVPRVSCGNVRWEAVAAMVLGWLATIGRCAVPSETKGTGRSGMVKFCVRESC